MSALTEVRDSRKLRMPRLSCASELAATILLVHTDC
jgi:hypothetical protein